MSWLQGVMAKIEAFRTPGEIKSRYSEWTENLTKKCANLNVLLDRTISPAQFKTVFQAMSDFNRHLSIEDFQEGEVENRIPIQVNLARKNMLDVWDKIINILGNVEKNHLTLFIITLQKLTVRSEFDPVNLRVHVRGRIDCSEEDIILLCKYRHLLYQTHGITVSKLSEQRSIDTVHNMLPSSYGLYSAYARLIAIHYFHIPPVQVQIMQNVKIDATIAKHLWNFEYPLPPPDAPLTDFENDLVSSQSPSSPARLENVGNSMSPSFGAKRVGRSVSFYDRELVDSIDTNKKIAEIEKIHHEFPSLFLWVHYDELAMYNGNGAKTDLNIIYKEDAWLTLFKKRTLFFLFFIKEWTDHVNQIKGNRELKFDEIPGYNLIVESFLYHFRTQKYLTKPVMDCSFALLTCDSSLINFFMKTIFTRTNVYNFTAVVDSLTKIEEWFAFLTKSESSLPQTFDAQYYCSALEVVFETDHHQLIARFLQHLYSFAHIFSGESRRIIFGEFLLKKFFFTLFLHWDEVVRNYFQQFLVFKMVRIKRSDLRKKGFMAPELSDVNLKNSIGSSDQPDQSKPNENTIIEEELYGKINAMIKIVEDQLRDGSAPKIYSKELEIYAPKAISDYKQYVSKYNQWEEKGDTTRMPALTSLSLTNGRSINLEKH
eukprot:TRINITY_DN4696_c0_g1_i1.p1 TRINITY_DN4696_c0_g1~~TRINITY_DN4696_c0_g1_i1.p1  ORF type:complete len:655 (-),score=117.07 TRINITY_DN4696_c0_g1_i1:48-2012(-)